MTKQAKRDTDYSEDPSRVTPASETGSGGERDNPSVARGTLFIVLKNLLFWGSCALSIWVLYLLFAK